MLIVHNKQYIHIYSNMDVITQDIFVYSNCNISSQAFACFRKKKSQDQESRQSVTIAFMDGEIYIVENDSRKRLGIIQSETKIWISSTVSVNTVLISQKHMTHSPQR